MYVVGNEITVTWIIPPTDTPLLAADYDISFADSELQGTYTDDAISNYVAPTAAYSGSLTYAFTPLIAGHYRLKLMVGAADSSCVMNHKDFWVFNNLPGTSRATRAISPQLTPGVEEVVTGVTTFLAWNKVNGVCLHPVDTHLLYVCGKEFSTDSLGTVAIINLNTQAVTTQQKFFPHLEMGGIAVNRNGRVLINRTVYTTDEFHCYYSDNLISWTETTNTWPNTAAAGITISHEVMWDDTIQLFLWTTNSYWLACENDMNFERQTFDLYGNNATSSFGFQMTRMRRLKPASSNVLYLAGEITFGAYLNGERTITTITTTHTNGFINPWWDNNAQMDMYGASHLSSLPIDFAMSPDGNTVWCLSEDGLLVPSTGVNEDNFDNTSVVDLTGTITGTAHYIFTLGDFGKMIIATWDTSIWRFYESTDQGLTWALSTDTRVTSYKMVVPANQQGRAICYYLDNSAVAFIDPNVADAERVVVYI